MRLYITSVFLVIFNMKFNYKALNGKRFRDAAMYTLTGRNYTPCILRPVNVCRVVFMDRLRLFVIHRVGKHGNINQGQNSTDYQTANCHIRQW